VELATARLYTHIVHIMGGAHTLKTEIPRPVQFAMRRRLDQRLIGIVMVISGSVLWGVSGTAAQQLFQHHAMSTKWLVSVRMLSAGLLLLVMVSIRQGTQVFQIWKAKHDVLKMLWFAIIGLIGVQYSYFQSIALGNAATATFLQYLAPILVTAWVVWTQRKAPTRRQQIALGLAVLGTFLLVTNGSLHGISVSAQSITWGLISAVTLAFYTLYPGALIRRYGCATVLGWGMLVGGLVFSLYGQPWRMQVTHWNLNAVALVIFVTVFGTFFAYYLYLSSTQRITPAETSLLATAEPLSAAAAAIVWLHTRLGVATLGGGLCILLTVAVLSWQRRVKSH